MAVLVQLEFLRGAPDVGGVRGGVDGQVPDEGDPVGVGEVPEGGPLAEEEVLGGPVDGKLRRELRLGGVQCGGMAEPKGILPVPPGSAAALGFQGGEEGVILQPEGVFPAEGGIVRRRGGEQPLRGLAQDSPALAVEEGVVHPAGILAPGEGLVVLRRQEAIRPQEVQVDEVGVPGIGGEGLVGRVAEAGLAQGQDLPVGLARRLQEADEVPGGLSQGADAPGGRQGEDRKKDTGAAFQRNHLTCIRLGKARRSRRGSG